LTRCLPTTISVSGSDKAMRIEKHSDLSVTDQGLVVAKQE